MARNPRALVQQDYHDTSGPIKSDFRPTNRGFVQGLSAEVLGEMLELWLRYGTAMTSARLSKDDTQWARSSVIEDFGEAQ